MNFFHLTMLQISNPLRQFLEIKEKRKLKTFLLIS